MRENLYANNGTIRDLYGINRLRLQRNILLLLVTGLIASNTLLAIKLYRQETITRLVPSLISEQVISQNFANDEALKVRAAELLGLIFSMKKENVDTISTTILSQVDNQYIDDFKQQMTDLSEDIRTKNYRYIFNDSQGYEFDNRNFTVKAKGFLETYMAGKQLSETYKEYLISFINRGGVLTLKSFEEVKDDQEN